MMITTNLARAEFFVGWRGEDSTHRDWQYFPKIDFWRDFMPGDLAERMQDQEGALVELEVTADNVQHEISPPRRDLPRDPVVNAFHRRHLHGPYDGRFYPRGVLAQINGVGTLFSQDTHPFRVLRTDEDHVEVDLGHPLGGTSLCVGGRIAEHRDTKKEERGGSCHDILADLVENGPGMQCPPAGGLVDFEQPDAFTRDDSTPDEAFYEKPRMVQHIDSQARAFINEAYRDAIRPGDHVLDLMSSWVSHLDGIAPRTQVTGLGMNEEELAANPRLDQYLVRDLNRESRLPWKDAEFDVTVCTVSVEYLTHPREVFAEVARVLRPGGRFVVTFSDRWFPPKAIRLWTLLHPFERMGLVLDYFRQSVEFGELETESWVGWTRPEDDKYSCVMLNSDPVFVVRGIRT